VNHAPAARKRGSGASGSSYLPNEAMEEADDNEVVGEVWFCKCDLFLSMFCSTLIVIYVLL
jgi:hypothetical protein